MGDESAAGGRIAGAGLGLAALADPQLAVAAAPAAPAVVAAGRGSGGAGLRHRPEPARTAGVPRPGMSPGATVHKVVAVPASLAHGLPWGTSEARGRS